MGMGATVHQLSCLSAFNIIDLLLFTSVILKFFYSPSVEAKFGAPVWVVNFVPFRLKFSCIYFPPV